MATKNIAWNIGNGNITLSYIGQGNDTIVVTSDPNDLYEDRSQVITVSTLDNSISRQVTITQMKRVSDYSKMYFTIESLEDNNTVSIENVNYGSTTLTFYYSTDNGENWNNIFVAKDTEENIATLDTGEKVLIKSSGVDRICDNNGCHHFNSTKNYKVYGNIMSLLRGDNFVSNPELPGTSYHFYKLFYNVTTLIDAENLILPSNTARGRCYFSLFEGCTALTKVPKLLPATTLAEECYRAMFKGCTNLITLPKLPATTLAQYCYKSMFNGCTSIISAPVLPATTLADYCYQYMFEGCTSLVNAPELPATTLKQYCYHKMFNGCTSLTTAPVLPAMTLALRCYDNMFAGCISLIEAPELPATTLAGWCYTGMFQMSASEMLMTPAMTKSPVLPATHVLDNCYNSMFKGNGNLNEVTCLTEDTSPQSIGYSTNVWLEKCSPTGTFIRSLSATGWSRGTSGIPSGWTVYSDGLLGISISGSDVINVREYTYSIAYNPSDTLDKYKGVTWSVVSGSATITQDGVLTPTAIGNVVIQAISTYDSTIVATKSITVQEELPYPLQYFTIESLTDSNTISIQNVGCSVKPTFYYSLDGGDTWSSVTMTQGGTKSIATINIGDKILFKSTNTKLATAYNQYNKFKGSKNFKVQGNAMSLLYGDDFKNNSEFASGSTDNLEGLFYGTTTLVDASNLVLPALTITSKAYNGMFRECSNLVTAPKLPGLTFTGTDNYSSMFEGCISLVEAPELPATTLAQSCYQRMFCMSRTAKLTTPAMTKSPVLPAISLGQKASVYKEMFKGNGNLTEVICLASKNRAAACFTDWLLNCSDTGVFKKDPSATWDSGDAATAIPSGWTVVDYIE